MHYYLVSGTSRGKIYRSDMRLFSRLSDAVEYSKVPYSIPNPVWRIELDGKRGMVICTTKWIREALDEMLPEKHDMPSAL